MSSGRGVSRVAVTVAVCSLVLSVVGFIVTVVLNAFVFDEFDAYGEVPIPGTGTVELPEGEVTVSFHTFVTGQTTSGFPIPAISIGIDAPAGVPDPTVTESIGGTTTVNSDTRVRIWMLDVAQEGEYQISTDGEVGGYISPRLAFGHGSTYGWLMWLFGGLVAASVLALAGALVWAARAGKAVRPLASHEVISVDSPPPLRAVPLAAAGASAGDQGIRLEQLRHLAALRDSGALTEDEFQAEKRRLLKG